MVKADNKKDENTMKRNVRIYVIDSGPKECGHIIILSGQIQHLSTVFFFFKEKYVPLPLVSLAHGI